jgi:hypothetical protein
MSTENLSLVGLVVCGPPTSHLVFHGGLKKSQILLCLAVANQSRSSESTTHSRYPSRETSDRFEFTLHDHKENVLAQSVCPQPFRARSHKSTNINAETLSQDTTQRPRKRHRLNPPADAVATPVELDTSPVPELKEIHPPVGSIRGGETVWICVLNLRRDQDIVIDFGGDRYANVKYLSVESDILQLLECTTPKSDRPCGVHLSIRDFYRRKMVISSHGKVAFEYLEENLHEKYVRRRQHPHWLLIESIGWEILRACAEARSTNYMHISWRTLRH